MYLSTLGPRNFPINDQSNKFFKRDSFGNYSLGGYVPQPNYTAAEVKEVIDIINHRFKVPMAHQTLIYISLVIAIISYIAA